MHAAWQQIAGAYIGPGLSFYGMLHVACGMGHWQAGRQLVARLQLM